jgi:hypothetical protein
MGTGTDPMADTIAATLEREAAIVRDAIAFVASGGSARVVVAGLRLGEALLESAQRMAAEAGVQVVPLWPADEAGLDIAIEGPAR